MEPAAPVTQNKRLIATDISKAGRRYLLPLSVAVVGCLFVFSLTREMWTHAVELEEHFVSGSWEVKTDQVAVQGSIEAQFGDRRKWSIHYLGGTSNSFPLMTEVREETITNLGQSVSDPSGILSSRFALLPDAYGDLLSDFILVRSLETSGQDLISIQQLAGLLRPHSTKYVRSPPEVFRKSQRALTTLPSTAALRRAIAAYWSASAATNYFTNFQVFTEPPYDNDDLLNLNTTTINDKVAKCAGEVSQVEGTEPPVTSTIERYPRVVKLEFRRLWLSDELLDNASTMRGDIAGKYFGANGRLRDVPANLWILMEDELHFESAQQTGEITIQKWDGLGECCKISCADSSVILSPTSVKRIGSKTKYWSGLVAGTPPSLFAVVSRHRVAR